MAIWGLCIAFGALVACIPPAGGAWSSQPGWQAAPSRQPARSHNAYDDEESSRSQSAYDDEEGNGERAQAPRRASDGSSWTCASEALVATNGDDSGSGPWVEREISLLGSGPTRDDAYNDAFSACSSIVSTTLAIGETGSGRAEIRSNCQITKCNRWGT